MGDTRYPPHHPVVAVWHCSPATLRAAQIEVISIVAELKINSNCRVEIKVAVTLKNTYMYNVHSDLISFQVENLTEEQKNGEETVITLLLLLLPLSIFMYLLVRLIILITFIYQ